jgi:hypothetical protein
MKTQDFAEALRKAADLMPLRDADQVRVLAKLFGASTLPTASASVKRVEKVALAPVEGQPTINEALQVLGRLHEFVRLYGKASFGNDLKSVTDLLQPYHNAGLYPFVDLALDALAKKSIKATPTLQRDAVDGYLRRLEHDLGNDPAFSVDFQELSHDVRVTKLEAVELAKLFAGKTAKSRADALKKIWARHHSLMAFKAKSESRDGRSAA